MTNLDDASPKHDQGPPPVVPTPPPPAAADVENQTEEQARTAGTGFGVAGIIRRWKRDDLLRRGSLALRGLALVFSLLAFIIMATNTHGDWKDFDKYEEYRSSHSSIHFICIDPVHRIIMIDRNIIVHYLLAIAILATLYTGAQAFRHATGKEMFQRRTSALADFIGDQIIAYLLISSASSAIPMTNRMRESQDNIFTDALASSISMAFLAFVTLALLALISGHKLSSRSYI